MPSTKFHIYKVENENTIDDLINNITEILDNNEIDFHIINRNNFRGFYFHNESSPNWADCISELMDDINAEEIFNRFSSYVIFKEANENIYVITGGHGHYYIKNFIENSFGLNLVPKLIENNDSVIKKVVDNPLMGNRLQISRTNRQPTNFEFESDLSNVYKQLDIQIDTQILNEFGLQEDNPTRIINKDSLSIEKNLTLDELSNVLDNLDGIYQRVPMFPLNPFTPLNKTNFKLEDVKKLFINQIYNKNFESISMDIVGNNISEYLDNTHYVLNFKDKINFDCYKSIEWEDLEIKFKEEQFTKKSLNELFYNTNLFTENDDGIETLNMVLINCLNGELYVDTEFNTLPEGEKLYLQNGKWYVIEEYYDEFFSTRFNRLYEESERFVTHNLFTRYSVIKSNWVELNGQFDENIYNDSFFEIEEVIEAHKYKQHQIELADLIIYDGNLDKLIMMCVKNGYDAKGCRDLFGQIEASIYYIKNYFITNRNDEIHEYYHKLLGRNGCLPIDENKFKELFINEKFCYIAAFLNNGFLNDISSFGKILAYNISKLLIEHNIQFYLLDYDFGD